MTMPKKGTNHKYLPGVYQPAGCKRFRAAIRRKGKIIYLGYYDTEQEAHEVYMAYKKEHCGDYSLSHQNFIKQPTTQRKINADLIGTPWFGL